MTPGGAGRKPVDDGSAGGGFSQTVGAMAARAPALGGAIRLSKFTDPSVVSIVTQAAMSSTRKVREDTAICTQAVGNLESSFKNLLGKVDAQGQALGKIAASLAELFTKIDQMPVGSVVSPTAATAGGIVIMKTNLAVTLSGHKGCQEMLRVRAKLREEAAFTMGNTKFTEDVYPDGDMTSDIIDGAVGSVLNLSGDAINDWLMQWIPNNARSQKGNDSASRARDPLQRLKPHLMQGLRKTALEAYCKEVGVNKDAMTPETALMWLQGDEYFQSSRGAKAIHAGIESIFRQVGPPHRIKAPTTPGGERVTDATVGHYSLFASFVRHFLEVLCGSRSPGRCGIADGAYEEWRDEICRIAAFWPSGVDMYHGVRLVDSGTMKAVIAQEDGAKDADDEEEA